MASFLSDPYELIELYIESIFADGFCRLGYEMQGNHKIILHFVFKMYLVQIMMNTKKKIKKITIWI